MSVLSVEKIVSIERASPITVAPFTPIPHSRRKIDLKYTGPRPGATLVKVSALWAAVKVRRVRSSLDESRKQAAGALGEGLGVPPIG